MTGWCSLRAVHGSGESQELRGVEATAFSVFGIVDVTTAYFCVDAVDWHECSNTPCMFHGVPSPCQGAFIPVRCNQIQHPEKRWGSRCSEHRRTQLESGLLRFVACLAAWGVCPSTVHSAPCVRAVHTVDCRRFLVSLCRVCQASGVRLLPTKGSPKQFLPNRCCSLWFSLFHRPDVNKMLLQLAWRNYEEVKNPLSVHEPPVLQKKSRRS